MYRLIYGVSHTGLTIARVYSNSETRETYRQIWSGLWDLVERTTGEIVKFKFLHGTGIRAIVVDGSKPQIQGCGDSLLSRNDATVTGINTVDAQEIVHWIVKLCMVHMNRYASNSHTHNAPYRLVICHRNFDTLAQSCPTEIMDRVRNIVNLESWEDVRIFGDWCESSTHKALRGSS